MVEPGNICRSEFNLFDLGESKVDAIYKKIISINPFLEKQNIKAHGHWTYLPNRNSYVEGSFYGEINYNDQSEAIKEIQDYELIIDCTGSNEMLHFLSYALPDKEILSLCITNHANELLCLSSKTGNPFELRKTYLSAIEQDTKNFYVEGIGCYSPTFLAKGCDISALVNLCFHHLNENYAANKRPDSFILGYDKRGIIDNTLKKFILPGKEISLVVPNEAILDAEDLPDDYEGILGYILGSISRNGKEIMVTHIINSTDAAISLGNKFNLSKGIIDYLGDVVYSGDERETYASKAFENIEEKASDPSININNPILAIRNPEGDITFFIYFNGKLEKFEAL